MNFVDFLCLTGGPKLDLNTVCTAQLTGLIQASIVRVSSIRTEDRHYRYLSRIRGG